MKKKKPTNKEVLPSYIVFSHDTENAGDLFTILTAAHNTKRYLGDWAKSIISQTYRPIEVVVVDDCSKDNTEAKMMEICKSFVKNNIQVRFIKNPMKKGCGTSYADAMGYANGKFFGVLDSDDMLKDFAVEYIVGLYKKYPEVTWIYTQFNKYSEKMNFMKIGCSRHPGGGSLLDLGETQAFSHWRTFSDRIPQKETIFKRDLKAAVDKYMGYRLEELGIGMFTNMVCYKYRKRNNSITTTPGLGPRVLWNKMRSAFSKKRRSENIKVFPILIHKEKNK
jgi:glycosyltransferase involved in cell wall biosynthesis